MSTKQEKTFFVRNMMLLLLSQTYLVLMMVSSDVKTIYLTIIILMGLVIEFYSNKKSLLKDNKWLFKAMARSISVAGIICCIVISIFSIFS